MRPCVSPGTCVIARKLHTKWALAERVRTGLQGCRREGRGALDAWLDACPVALTDDQRNRVMRIIAG